MSTFVWKNEHDALFTKCQRQESRRFLSNHQTTREFAEQNESFIGWIGKVIYLLINNTATMERRECYENCLPFSIIFLWFCLSFINSLPTAVFNKLYLSYSFRLPSDRRGTQALQPRRCSNPWGWSHLHSSPGNDQWSDLPARPLLLSAHRRLQRSV